MNTPATFRVQTRAVLLTWSQLPEEPTTGLVARYEHFCCNRPRHWHTLAVVKRHDPAQENYDPARPLHVHALTISVAQKNGWNTRSPSFWDFEGNHPNIKPKDARDGPGGNPIRTDFHYLWKDVGAEGEVIEYLMAGDLTEELLAEVVLSPGNKKRSRMEADLEDGKAILEAPNKRVFFETFAELQPLRMLTAWNSVRAYTKHHYQENIGLNPPIPVELEFPEVREHVEQADAWFEREVPRKAPGMHHRIMVIEGATGMGKTAYARSKTMHSRMCNVWNVATLSQDADVWILDDMVHTNRRYSLKALSQDEADFTGRYKHVMSMKVRPTIILGNSQEAIMKCWSDIEGEDGEAWVAGNVDWVYAGNAPFFVFP